MKRLDVLKATPENFMQFMDDNDKAEMLSDESNLSRPQRKLSHFERTRAQVYATGNKWAIENFEATHN